MTANIDEIRQKILENAGAPKKVTSDGTTVEQYDIEEQLAMLDRLEKEEAKKNKHSRFRVIKMEAGGAN